MIFADLLLGALAVAWLTLPGWWLARAWRVPQPVMAGFVGGIVVLVNLLVALDALRVGLSMANVGGAWLVVTAFAVFAARKKSSPSSPSPPFAWREHWPLLVPLTPALAVVAYRAIAQPLFGIDTIFRWDWLARQMFARGTLAFYPPASAADYEIYAWPDGIAPAVSSLYFFAYALARAARPALTAPVVIAQFALLLAAVFALARKYFSHRAAALALALLAASPLVLWGVAMGQETGLTALSLAAMLLWLPRSRDEENLPALAAAALAAALGALAREYGLAWPLLGLALGFTHRLSPRALLTFTLIAAAGTLPWYARNWLRTGNPLFDLDVAGLFPVNAAHTWLVEGYQREFGWAHLPPGAGGQFATLTAVALAGGAVGAWFFRRESRALRGAIALVGAIWIASVGYTAAGWTYALRVLAPALALGAVLGGAALARWVPERRRLAGTSGALALLALDASLRTLVLPANVYRLPPSAWLTTGGALEELHTRPVFHAVAERVGAARVLVLGPNTLLAAQGARTLPLWSPEVNFLFDANATPVATAQRLRALGIEFAFLTKGPANERYLAHSAFFREPGGMLQALWSDEDFIFLRIADPMAK